MVSHWSLSDSKSPQISGTLLNILADLNNAVVFRSFLLSAPLTIGITVTFKLHSFLVLKQGQGTYISFRFFFLVLLSDPPGR